MRDGFPAVSFPLLLAVSLSIQLFLFPQPLSLLPPFALSPSRLCGGAECGNRSVSQRCVIVPLVLPISSLHGVFLLASPPPLFFPTPSLRSSHVAVLLNVFVRPLLQL
uniref:Uncharacterized protein n=1 Tax=Leishmania guyanensis TaxID=5670 RepID=A0A1E1J2Q8_LEIGU|nr:Hypothetical protein BN36_2845780 [Leishmania guyanensis]